MRARRALLGAAAGLLLLAVAAPGLAQHDDAPAALPPPPPGPAAIHGQVLRATTGEPVAGADVALYALSRSGVPGVMRATSDAEGRFSFEGLSNDPAHSYLVGARHAGVPHPGGRVRFQEGQLEARIEVRVSDVVADPAQVRIAEASFRLDHLGGSVRVGQSFALRNDGAESYFVPKSQRGGGRAVLEVRLPAGASELDMPLGVMPEGLERDGDRLRYFGPVHPGPSEVAWSYLLPLEAEGSLRFEPPIPQGAREVVVLVNEAADIVSPGRLAAGEDVTLDGRSYRRFSGAGATPLTFELAFAPSRIDPDALTVEEVRLVMQADDAALEVQETHTLWVDGETGVRAPGDREPLLHIPLPERASNLRFGTSDPGLVLAPDPEGGLGVLGTAPAGESRIDLAYRVAAGSDGIRFGRTFGMHVPLVSMFLADTGQLRVTSDQLHRRRPTRTSDLTYMHLEAFEVAPGEEVALHISTRDAGVTLPRGAMLAIVGALGLAAIALLVAPLRRGVAATDATTEPQESASERERAALYASIRDLEHDFETGKVSEEDHRMLRAELRGRAVDLLRSERADQTDPAAAEGADAATESGAEPPTHATGEVPEPPAERDACPTCGAGRRAADRFCAQCGGALAPAARTGADNEVDGHPDQA